MTKKNKTLQQERALTQQKNKNQCQKFQENLKFKKNIIQVLKWRRKVPEVEGRVASTFEEAAKQLPIVEIQMKRDTNEYKWSNH